MAAALRARERRMQAVAKGEPKLGRHRRVVLVPVGEEVPNVHPDLVEEPAHQPPPFLPAHSSVGIRSASGNRSFLPPGLILSAEKSRPRQSFTTQTGKSSSSIRRIASVWRSSNAMTSCPRTVSDDSAPPVSQAHTR